MNRTLPANDTDLTPRALAEVVPLRIGFISDRPASRTPDGIRTNSALARLMTRLSRRSQEFHAALSRFQQPSVGEDCLLTDVCDTMLPLPEMPTMAAGLARVPGAVRVIRRIEAVSDVVIVQMPFAATPALFRPQRPRVYNVCANIVTAARSGAYRGPKRWAAWAASHSIDAMQARLLAARNSALVTHGRELLDRYAQSHGVSVVSSSILPEEVASVPRQRPADAPFRVLYVGYLRHWKGVGVLLEAFDHLLRKLPAAELVVVGARDLGGANPPEFDALITALSNAGRLRLLGHLPFGTELFQQYADADATVVSSLGGEGTPRVLIEARAFGCPVIGTRVGGIPDSIEHEIDGLLVAPHDAQAVADSILRIASDRALRHRLIAGGYARARKTTVNDYADVLIEQAWRVFNEHSLRGSAGPDRSRASE